jgi:hypothetical protein
MSGTIYISRRSQPCQELLIRLHKNREIISFPIVDIDKNPYPKIIKSVPCMIVENQILPGGELFKYIDYLIHEYKKQNKQNDYVNNDNYKTNQAPHPEPNNSIPRNQSNNYEGPSEDNGLDLEGFCIGGICDLGFSMLEEDKNEGINRDNYEYLDNTMEHTQKNIETSNKSDRAKEIDDEYARMMEMRGEQSMGGGMR